MSDDVPRIECLRCGFVQKFPQGFGPSETTLFDKYHDCSTITLQSEVTRLRAENAELQAGIEQGRRLAEENMRLRAVMAYLNTAFLANEQVDFDVVAALASHPPAEVPQ